MTKLEELRDIADKAVIIYKEAWNAFVKAAINYSKSSQMTNYEVLPEFNTKIEAWNAFVKAHDAYQAEKGKEDE